MIEYRQDKKKGIDIMEKMVALGIEIAQTIEAPRKNYILTENGENHYLSLTDDQISFMNWLDNWGLLYEFNFEEVKNIEFEKI